MALTFFRRRRIVPLRPPPEQPAPRMLVRGGAVLTEDDYLIEGEEITEQPSAGARAVHTLQILLIIFMAILALAIVWMLGVVFNIL